MSPPSAISGFTVIPISYSKSSTHYIYARAHISNKKPGQKNSWPAGRTLFAVNVPPDATERDMILLLKPYGIVERVVFDSDNLYLLEEKEAEEEDEDSDGGDVEEENVVGNGETQPRKRRKVVAAEPPKVFELPSIPLRKLRKTGQSAHVVFLDESSLDRFFAASHTKPRPWPTSSEEPSGLAHYLALYDSLRPPLDAVRQHADSSMDLYEFELAKSKRQASKYKKGEAIVDEDGFTLVTRGGAYGQTVGGGVAVATKRFQETGETSERKRKRSKKEKTSFYAFQKAEKQRNELLQMKKNWELDKAKVEKLKASRKFKPY
ncbi:hypothetical protein D9757_001072 [Collybiopsis confluens]|uniref:Ribosomal RNA-processing protein 7 n=1 Tax=Collybiopsis confluens TaxID=2823264 RepID=A0A8H5I0B7_9AGAR|nr:hypothetical protein D9757_001072 [Collybiopsis confluens]